MKTEHRLLRLHNDFLDANLAIANIVCNSVNGFMGNYFGKDFDCGVRGGPRWLDIVITCTDVQEKLAHACAWGCSTGIIDYQ